MKIEESNVAIGTIVMWGGNKFPNGWLVCDGTICEQSTYSELYTVIGHNFGDQRHIQARSATARRF